VLVAAALALPPLVLQADDTDIYINPSSPSADEPMVMFVLDWRPNLVSTVCNSFSGGDSDADIASACGWDASFVANFTSDDKSDGVINRFELLRAVLKEAMSSLDGVKIGLMMNHDDTCHGSPSSGPGKSGCSNGAYVVSGFNSIDASDTNGNKAAFHNLLANIPDPAGSENHKFQGKEVYFELFRYLTGQDIYNGHLGWDDFGTDSTDNLDVDNPDIMWDDTIPDGTATPPVLGVEDATHTQYISPFNDATSCTKVFVINFMFGVLNNQDNSDDAISDTKGSGGMNELTLSGGKDSQFESVIQWLHTNDLADNTYGTAPDIDGDQTVTSYFVVESPSTSENGFADAGGTGTAIAWSDDPSEMVTKITDIFKQILSVSTTFVSASVPVNVFNRAEFLNDVFIAVFEADEDAKPKWNGNLKKLKLGQDSSGTDIIADANGDAALASDGRIKYSALTYWTDDMGADVVGTTSPEEISGYDGRSIDRGGAGQQIQGFLSGSPGLNNTDSGARQLFTEPSSYTNGSSTSLMALDATATNADNLWSFLNTDGIVSSGTTLNAKSWSVAANYSSASAAEKTEALDLLKFARGIDVTDEDGDSDTTDPRPWLLADPIHSRPLTLNYGARDDYTTSNPDVRIIMGGNDGFVHMFKNTEMVDSGTVDGDGNTIYDAEESGEETWAFMPRAAMSVLKRLKDNDPETPTTGPVHPYGADGAPVAYVLDNNNNGTIETPDSDGNDDKVYVFFGMRRGGKGYYALDLSDPDNPKMLWSISKADSDFSELGLTFSIPRVAYVNYDSNVKEPVLIFGGGYDTNKDTRSNSLGTDDSEGRGIFIVKIADGSLVWKADYDATDSGWVSASKSYGSSALVDSIPSDITSVDTDGDRAVDRLYVGDTGGNVWRVDLAGTDRSNWTLNKLASLGRHSGANKRDDRRFFHRPDFVQTRDGDGNFDAVIIGSGDRANPQDTDVGSNVPENYLYMIKDRSTTTGDLSELPFSDSTSFTQGDFADLTDNCHQEVGVSCSDSETNGWVIKLEAVEGEKILSTPITLGGIVFFTTYQPPDGSSAGCGPSEGSGALGAVKLQDASAAFDFDKTNTTTGGDGTVHELQVEDRYKSIGDGIPADVISIGLDKVLPPGSNPITVPVRTRWRTFWYVEGE
jgi:type IV pilus assembly protein PilY1